ncbi:hypothetical protein VTN77DRAFT_7834 [Rasamsonia byssochlamydoides]|uniref:uncharacterized protein n=1 Tax=Rasamsonia byssochlamydoides TaxID=89139 RepID=UPI003743E066
MRMDAVTMHTTKEHTFCQMMKRNKTESTFCITSISLSSEENFTLHQSARILSLGTGTGIWAIQFANEYPSAQVIGTDLSPIQPPWVPPNCVFEIDD